MTPEQIEKFFELHDLAKSIINSDRPWEDKYYLIFSEDISGAIASCDVHIEWYDTNMTQEENIMAYWDLLDHQYKELQKIQMKVE